MSDHVTGPAGLADEKEFEVMTDGATAASFPCDSNTSRLARRTRTSPAEPVTPIDGMRFRTILGRFATGVVAVTAIDPRTGGPTGLAVNAFTSVSLDPPLVAFCVGHASNTWLRVRAATRICVNILAETQHDVCVRLATSGADKFAGVDWTRSPGGGPVIDGSLAWLECSVEDEHPAGDHSIIVARVHHLEKHHDGDPLLFYRGAYGGFADRNA